jgi:predicted nucleic acid-binding protein
MPRGVEWAKAHYLDASALVKLVVDEGNCQPLRTFFNSNTSFCATSLCLSEALGVLKRKWSRKQINFDEYFAGIRELIIHGWSKRVEIDDLGLLNPIVQADVELIAKKHQLDFSDALQLLTILKGRYSVLGSNSQSVLITADHKLATAASAEGIRVWNCISGPVPGWA